MEIIDMRFSDEYKDKILHDFLQIINYLKENCYASTSDISELLDLSKSRVRAILSEMDSVVAEGKNKNRKYRLK